MVQQIELSQRARRIIPFPPYGPCEKILLWKALWHSPARLTPESSKPSLPAVLIASHGVSSQILLSSYPLPCRRPMTLSIARLGLWGLWQTTLLERVGQIDTLPLYYFSLIEIRRGRREALSTKRVQSADGLHFPWFYSAYFRKL